MSDNATENILRAISRLDQSMSKMVEQDPENMEALYGSIRLQLENLEAKVTTLTPDIEREDINDFDKPFHELDESLRQDLNVEDYRYLKKVDKAEEWFDEQDSIDTQKLRKYMRKRLEAIYYILDQKSIYQTITTYDTDDLDVIDPKEMEVK